ncbi:ankyrin repeat domain-containing protein [Wolbachia endosymbiont of Laodelphax striatellus]|uniref:ankyrin repeat domain-containing protein n=1 Tax=Wolbachia endosymbiont of Laodelphax striatellus TaxID=368602 RepID=UPI00117D9480|nr:ankyrin repeat domain-containing protein [Wolbachia endosymbiont of Laodelphax striatellus]
MLKLEQWKEILDAANSNKGDILEAIKEKLKKKDKDTYQVWERNDFDVNHPFSVLFDINSDQHYYSTLLNLAVANDHLKIVKYLVDNKNVNLDQKNNNGKTPLHHATLASSLKTVKALLENGADINAKDNNGRTPLHWATFNHRVEIIKALLENGADINAKDNNGRTPLRYAVGYGEYDMCYDGVKFLIAHEVKLKGSKAQKPEYLVQYGSNFIKEMSEYWDKRLEIERMKEKKIDRGITLYDILICKDSELVCYARKGILQRALENDNYRNEFPIHANDLKDQYAKGTEGLILSDEIEHLSQKRQKLFLRKDEEKPDTITKLPTELLEAVATHLENASTNNFKKALEINI